MPEYLYVLRCGDYMKVGRSNFPHRRARQIAAGNPYEVELVYQAEVRDPGIALAEETAHRRLAEHHHRGEWFSCPAEIAVREVDGAIAEVVAVVKARYSKVASIARYRADRATGLTPTEARRLEAFRRGYASKPKSSRRASKVIKEVP